jgi:hypothetical protein
VLFCICWPGALLEAPGELCELVCANAAVANKRALVTIADLRSISVS